MAADTHDLTNAIHDMTRQLGVALQNVRQGGPGQNRDRQRLEADLTRRTGRLRDGMGAAAERVFDFATSLQGAKRHLTDFAAGFAGGAVAGMLERTLTSYTETYKGLSDMGQTFGGSMLAMGQAAADAALPLESYADSLRTNARTISRLGREQFFELSRSVRDLTYDFGMFGMTAEQLTDGYGAYVETLRISDAKRALTEKQQALSYFDLLKNTTNLAAVMGTSREEIQSGVQSVLSDAVVAADLSRLPPEIQARVTKSLSDVTSVFAAQGGEVGKTLADMIRQSVPLGTAVYSDMGQMLVEAGAGDLIGVIDPLIQQVRAGTATIEDSVAVTNRIKNYFKNDPMKLDALIKLARTGHEPAVQLLDLVQNAREITDEMLKRMKQEAQRQTAWTAFMTNLSNLYNKIAGTIRGGFLDAIETTTGGIAKFGEWFDPDSPNRKDNLIATFAAVGTATGEIAGQLMNWVASIKPEDVRAAMDGILLAVETVGSVVQTVIEALSALYAGLSSFMDPKWALGMTAFAGIVTAMGAKKIGEGILGKIGSMFVNATSVVVTGGGVGPSGPASKGFLGTALGAAGRGAAIFGSLAAIMNDSGIAPIFDYALSGHAPVIGDGNMSAFAEEHMKSELDSVRRSQDKLKDVIKLFGFGEDSAEDVFKKIEEKTLRYEQLTDLLAQREPGSAIYDRHAKQLEDLSAEIAKLTDVYAALTVEQLRLMKEGNQTQKDIKNNTSE